MMLTLCLFKAKGRPSAVEEPEPREKRKLEVVEPDEDPQPVKDLQPVKDPQPVKDSQPRKRRKGRGASGGTGTS